MATGTQSDISLQDVAGTSTGFEVPRTVQQSLRNLDSQPSNTQNRSQIKKQCSLTSAESSKLDMPKFFENQGQCFAFRGLDVYQSYMKLSGTESVGFGRGRNEDQGQIEGQPRGVVVNTTGSRWHPATQPCTQNVTAGASTHGTEGVSYTDRNTFNSLTAFGVSGNPVAGFVPNRSCPWPEELLCLCRMLKFRCQNAMSSHPTTYRELVILAETRPGHARQCYQLAQLMFFISAFACQMRSALEILIKTLTVLNSTDFEPGQLVFAVRKVASVFPLLDVEVQDICTKLIRRAVPDDQPMQASAPTHADQTGAQWQLLSASQQLDIAGESLEMASRLLGKFPRLDDGCSIDSSKCPMHSGTYFQRACPKERLMILALKFSSIGEKVCRLLEVVKHSKYKQ